MKSKLGLYFLGLIILLGTLASYQFHAGRSFEQRYYDFLFQFRQQISPAKYSEKSPVVLVTIDDESLEWIGSWPWPRSYHGKLLRELNAHGASLVGFDVIFDSPQTLGVDEDKKFAEMLGKTKNTFLASMFNYRKAENLARIESYRKPIALLANKSKGSGFANPLPDSDGSVRRAQLLTFFENHRYPSQVLSIFKAYQKIDTQVEIQKNYLKIGNTLVPYDNEGAFKINFAGPAGYFKRIPYNQILDGSYFKRDPKAVAGKIVLIGATSPLLQDIFSSPFSRQKSMPGVELQAHQLHTLLTQKFIREPSPIINFGILSGSILILFFILLRFKGLAGLVVGLVFASAVVVINLLQFTRFRIYVEAVPYFLLSLPVYLIGISTWQYFAENTEKNFISRIFKKYMDSQVVDQVLKQSGSLLGDKREMTVLFCDLKGFTRFSESHPPEAVVKLLNHFLEKMTEVVAKNSGTIDKYMGDSVMAFWGAPKLLEKHAWLAVKSGFEMLQVLKQLKQREMQWLGFEISIGINTGPMIVGNVGSAHHLSYTVIGDAVNTAARLQTVDLPEKNGSHLIISEATYKLLPASVQVLDLGVLALKGKAQGVRSYEVIGLESQEVK